MKYIGLIRTDDLPSTSIGLRVSEMSRLGFAEIILYTKTRITVAKQFKKATVVSDCKALSDRLVLHGDAIVVMSGRHGVDDSCLKALGVPGSGECRCLAGKKFVGSTSEGDRNVVKVFEYDRRKGIARFDRGDSGDVQIDAPDHKGAMAMLARDIVKMLESGDEFMTSDHEFQYVSDKNGITPICVDPITAGVRWHMSVMHGEKRPVNVVYGERLSKNWSHEKRMAVAKTKVATNEEKTTISNNQVSIQPQVIEDKKETGRTDDRMPVGHNRVDHVIEPSILSVVFITRNRTAVACECLNSLCKNLLYSGEIHWCICDDRSDRGHVDALIGVLRNNNITSFSVHYTDEKNYGLGASMNNGLMFSYKFTDIALTAEDDFLLLKSLNMDRYVAEAMKPTVAGIKLAANMEKFCYPIAISPSGFYTLAVNEKLHRVQRGLFNNLVMLRTKRAFDTVGFYTENVIADTSESDMIVRFNLAANGGRSGMLNVLWPRELKLNTMHTGLFEHIGSSTVGHNHPILQKYAVLNEKSAITARRETIMSFFHIIIPHYNCPALLDRCLSSIAAQTFKDYIVTVVDDVSDNEKIPELVNVIKKYKNVILLPLRRKRCAGGARNHAIDHAGESQYTLFIDSDDEFVNEKVLENIFNSIEFNGMPDVLTLGYIHGNVIKKFENADGLHMGVAPWTRCTKTSTLQRFNEDRMMCNDTLQYLRTIQNVKTVADSGLIAVRYNSDNQESGWHSRTTRMRKDRIEGMLLTMSDIHEENWTGYAKKEAERMMAYIRKYAMQALEVK